MLDQQIIAFIINNPFLGTITILSAGTIFFYIYKDLFKTRPFKKQLESSRQIIMQLEEKIHTIEEENASLKTTVSKKESRNHTLAKYIFIEELGIHKSLADGNYYCPYCLNKAIESPLSKQPDGWHCPTCKYSFQEKSSKQPPIR